MPTWSGILSRAAKIREAKYTPDFITSFLSRVRLNLRVGFANYDFFFLGLSLNRLYLVILLI